MFLPYHITKTSQPQVSVGIDWSNPIARGLVTVYSSSRRLTHDLCSPTVAGSATFSAGQAGLAAKLSSSTDYFTHPGSWSRLGTFTFITLYKLTATPGGSVRVAGSRVSASTGYYIAPNATNYRAMFSANGDTIVGTSIVVGKLKCDAITSSPAGTNYYENGNLSGSSAIAAEASSGDFRIGADSSGSNSAVCEVYGYLLFNRVLAPLEIKYLSDNPWQIFAPQQQILFLTSGSGTTYNITPSGSISFSGTAVRNNTKILVNSGTITFNGSAPITLVNGATTYTIIPTGNISLTGSATNIRSKVLSSGGTLTLTGSSLFKRTRTFLSTGVLSMLGTVITSKTKVYTPTGNVTFSGTATMYMPGVTVQTTKLPLTGVGT